MRINKHDTQGTKPLLGKGELGYDDYVAGGDVGRVYVGTGSENIALAEKSEIDSHVNRVDNPHNVTKAQVGLGNVDNTEDANKNVLSATKLTTARTIALTGDVTGSVSFDGSANVSITATVADDSHNHVISNVDGLQVALDSKVDKVSKQSLDSNSALRVSGTTVSLYKGDGTFDSITTQDTVYTLPTATSTVKGGIEVFSDTVQTVASNSVSTTAGRTYGIQLNSDGQAVVNVPWSDTNTVYTHPNSGVIAGTYSKVTVNTHGHITDGASLSASDIPSLDASKITSGTIDPARLPSFVDDVLEFANLAGFPSTGEAGKIYIALDTNKSYRWSGSTYVYITSGAVDSVNGQTGVVNITNITGNSGTATKLQTTRNIALTGDVTGNINFDGSANVSIATTIAANSVALGTDTTGNYVAGVTAGTGISISGTADEGWSPTITNTAPNVTTDISVTHDTSSVTVNSSDGLDGTINAASQTLAGIMTAADKTKLDGIATGATANTGTVTSIATSGAITGGTITTSGTISHSTADGYLHVPATGTTNNGKVLTAGATAGSLSWTTIPSAPVTSVAGKTGAVTLVKGDVGLGSVDNTADSTKNVLSATKLTTARTISLAGDVTGSVSFDGSANASITATITDNSHNHSDLTGTVIFSGSTGNMFNNSNIMVNGNGTANTIKPSIGFHQPGIYSGTLAMLDGDTFQFKKQDGITSAILGNSITGNANTATKLTNSQSDWVSSGAIANVVGMLSWKNYSNNHVIFDASNGTSPSGTPINNANPQVGWNATYPTLMGWNGTNTYGVRVDAARYSESCTGNANTATALQTARTINDVSFDGTANITIYDSSKAPLESPAFTGTPTAPTPTAGDNSTKIATTAFVLANRLQDKSFTAGTMLEALAASEVSFWSSTYIKKKEISVGTGGTITVSFRLRSEGNGVYGQIYVNGVAVGTVRTTTSTAYVTYTQNITVAAGDLVQLYVKGGNSGAGYYAYVDQFKILVGVPITSVVVLN